MKIDGNVMFRSSRQYVLSLFSLTSYFTLLSHLLIFGVFMM